MTMTYGYRLFRPHIVVLAAFTFLTLLPLSAQTAKEPLPPLQEILAKVMARAKVEKDQKHDTQYAATRYSVTDTLNKNGGIEEHNEFLRQPFLIEGHLFYRTMEKNGKPLNEEDAKKQTDREQKFREGLHKPPSEKKKNNEDDAELNDEMLSRFNFALIGVEEVGGRPAYLLTFLPRTGTKLPEKKTFDKILNRVAGKIWFDQETYSMVRLDLHLTEPTSFVMGLGNVRSLDLYLETMLVAQGIFQTKEQRVSFEGRQLFKTIAFKQHELFTDYHKVSELADVKH